MRRQMLQSPLLRQATLVTVCTGSFWKKYGARSIARRVNRSGALAFAGQAGLAGRVLLSRALSPLPELVYGGAGGNRHSH